MCLSEWFSDTAQVISLILLSDKNRYQSIVRQNNLDNASDAGTKIFEQAAIYSLYQRYK